MASPNGVFTGESPNPDGVVTTDYSKPLLIDDHDPARALERLRTSSTGQVTLSADAFERLYLQPKIAGSRHPLSKIFGNPTPLGIIGFEMSLMPITMQLMRWRGATGNGASDIAQIIFFGGVLMWTAGLLEFFLANTFPFLVFMTFGSFYAAYACTMIPFFASFAQFSGEEDPYTNPYAGALDPHFNAAYGHFWTAFTILMLFMTICTFRTNVLFVLLFLTITPGVGCIAGIFYNIALGNADMAWNCQKAAGGILFTSTLLGWYLFAALIFPSVDFPVKVPLGDLSGIVPGLSDLEARRGSRTTERMKGFFGRRKKSSREAA